MDFPKYQSNRNARVKKIAENEKVWKFIGGAEIQDIIEDSMSEQYQKKFLFHYSRNPNSASRLNVNLSCLQKREDICTCTFKLE